MLIQIQIIRIGPVENNNLNVNRKWDHLSDAKSKEVDQMLTNSRYSHNQQFGVTLTLIQELV